MNRIRQWFSSDQTRKNLVSAIIIAGFLLLLVLLTFLPPVEKYFVRERQVAAIAKLGIGILDFPALIVGMLASVVFERPIQVLLYFLTFFAIALFVGFVATNLWKQGRNGRFALVGFVIGNLLLGICFNLLGDTLIDPDSQSCELALSDEQRIRIIHYSEIGWESGEYLFYLFSPDGKSWNQIHWIRFDDTSGRMYRAECDKIRNKDNQIIWLWQNYDLIKSNDSGKTWQISKLPFSLIGYDEIREIAFTSESNACVETLPQVKTKPPKLVCTLDGGVTWQITSPN